MSKEHKVVKRLTPTVDETLAESEGKTNDDCLDNMGDSTLDSVTTDEAEAEQDASNQRVAKEQEIITNADESNSQHDTQRHAIDCGTHKTDSINDIVQAQKSNLAELKSSSSSAAKKRIALNVEPETLTPSTPSQTPPQVPTSISAAAAIPDNILSPPKSETQTDETNTATSTSTSPASDTQLSSSSIPPFVATEQAALEAQSTTTAAAASDEVIQKSNDSITKSQTATTIQQKLETRLPINGSIPKSGKPLSVTALNKKLKSPARAPRSRRPKVSLPMYESEISDNKIGIKLCIKKSDITEAAEAAVSATTSTTTSKPMRKRSRKTKQQKIDSDESEYEPRKKRTGGGTNNNGERQKRVSFSTTTATTQEKNAEQRIIIDQSVWAERLPENVLLKIFKYMVNKEGSLPTLFRLGRVCSLWRQVSLQSSLWRSIDLTTLMKEKHRTELKLKWFVDNRCSACTDLNVSNWKVSDVNCFLSKLANGCPNLVGITLSGWKGFTSDHLTILVENMKKLQRLDLSSINLEMNASKTAVGIQSLCNALQNMGSRLTHLYLAHNRLAGIPQIVNVLSTHCPNLTLLDLSNVTTQATSHGVLHIEKLQRGCQKLRVLRITNSHITPSTANIQETMDSPGFPNLEELSVAALTDESRIISDDHLQRILKSSAKLNFLDVRNCSRLTHESLIRLPAWDIKHLFLSGCLVTRDVGSGLELIASKWAHSLIDLDLAWANVQQPLDNALRALAEKGSDSPLAHLNLCGSSVSEAAVKEILANCAYMSSINLASCRGLPRGVKRLMQGPQELHELREVLKVQLKVKLPAHRLHVQQSNSADDAGGGVTDDGDAGGGDRSK